MIRIWPGKPACHRFARRLTSVLATNPQLAAPGLQQRAPVAFDHVVPHEVFFEPLAAGQPHFAPKLWIIEQTPNLLGQVEWVAWLEQQSASAHR